MSISRTQQGLRTGGALWGLLVSIVSSFNTEAIRLRNEERKRLKAECSPAPWYTRFLDDDYASNLVAISTRPDTGRHERWPKFSGEDIVAATLVQFPERYVDVADGRWNENAEFIAFSRGDGVEEDVDSLLQEVVRLRAALEQIT